MNKIALFKKMISENQVYLWMVLLTLALGVFSYFNADFFFPSEIKEIWKEKIAQWESLSSDEFVKKLEKNLPLSYLLKITFLLGFIFLIFGLYLSFLFFSSLVRGRISFSTQDFPQVNWQVSDIFRAVIIIFFLINIVKVSLSVFFQFFEPNLTRLSWQFLIQAFLIDLFSLGVIFYFVHKKHLSPFTQLGLRWENLINNLLVAFFHYIGLVPLLFLAVILSFSFTTFLKYKPEPSPLLIFFFHSQPKSSLFLILFFITIFAPITEEIFFRGFCYPVLRSKFGPLKAMFLVSFCFAWLHMNVIGFLPIFILGFLLVYVYEQRKTLLPSIFIHALHNSLILYFLFVYKFLWLE